ncbi:response regulator [Paenibacillus sp. WLX1005]|uniref:response regulator n=1 Tax=Paenibacillus sp. WLX1005 TaxID=3243766 RepID=UPI003983F75F
MRQLLIVDDEKNIRHGLQVMIERQFPGRYVIRSVRHGREGLEAIMQLAADLIITDIRMPVLDGIGMLDELRGMAELSVQPEVIVLSGHDDFEYAKAAIRYQVREYLLKPIRREDLFQALERLEVELHQRDERARKLADAQQYRTRWQEEQLSRLLDSNGQDADNMRMDGDLPDLPHPYVICIWQCVTADGHPVPVQELDMLLRQLDAGEGYGTSAIADTQLLDREGRRVWIVHDQQLPRLQELAQAAGRRDVSGLWVGMSLAGEGIARLPLAYTEACRALGYGFFCPGVYLLHYQPEQEYVASSSVSEEEIRQLGNLLGTGDVEEMNRRLHRLFRLSELHHMNIDVVRRTVLLVNEHILDEVFRHFGEASLEVLRLYRRVCSLEHYRYFHDYYRDLERLLLCLDEYIGQLRFVHSEHHRLREAVEYMQQHYDRPLNMAMVSNHVSLNYSYFSEAFKAYTGENFVLYLKKLRIARAKPLLHESELRLSEVSRQVGFESSRHFSKVFRELEGITPQQYRSKLELRSKIY